MKHLLTRTVLSLLFLGGITPAIQAELTESDMTFQIKVYTQLPTKPNGDKWTQNYQVTTYNTGYVAQKLAAQKNFSVSKNARVIQCLRQRLGTISNYCVVRDKGKVDVPVDLASIVLGSSDDTRKASGSYSKNTSNASILSNGSYQVTLSETENFSHTGTMKSTLRIVDSKENPGSPLYLFSRTLVGHGFYRSPASGVIMDQYSTVVIKVSPPKVLPNPEG